MSSLEERIEEYLELKISTEVLSNSLVEGIGYNIVIGKKEGRIQIDYPEKDYHYYLGAGESILSALATVISHVNKEYGK